eukprot:TRINITY_DN433_c0_g1_i1.p1 TRINITY_DN433_c0_g1~~TRINITY_DN433_c0_g1_i1.p1  ORF type:complete len:698 (+),score=97.30 TRINITY_DN433_c0_g1_i1:60-2153(+)
MRVWFIVLVLAGLALSKSLVREITVTSNDKETIFINGVTEPTLHLVRGVNYRFYLEIPDPDSFLIYDEQDRIYSSAIYRVFSQTDSDYQLMLWEVWGETPDMLFYGWENKKTRWNIVILSEGPQMLVTYSSVNLQHDSKLYLPFSSPLTLFIRNYGSGLLKLSSPPMLNENTPLTPEGFVPEDHFVVPPGESIALVVPEIPEVNPITLDIFSNDIRMFYQITINREEKADVEKGLGTNCTWDEWSACSRKCGGGIRLRRGNCGTLNSPCNLPSCGVDLVGMMPCNWAEWGDWTGCTCQQKNWRSKSCNCPHLLPEEYDYSFCSGEQPEQSIDCERNCCEWQEGTWSGCASCDGTRTKTEQCVCPPSSTAFTCSGEPRVQIESCNNDKVCCTFGWKEWSPCSGSCASGRHRTREQTCACNTTSVDLCADLKTEQAECMDGDDGKRCPRGPEYWLVNWPANISASICNKSWYDIISNPSQSSWYSMAKDYIAMSLSVAQGYPARSSLLNLLQESYVVLNSNCNNQLDVEAKLVAKDLEASFIAASETDENDAIPSNIDSVEQKSGLQWIILGVVGIVLVFGAIIFIVLYKKTRLSKVIRWESLKGEDEDEKVESQDISLDEGQGHDGPEEEVLKAKAGANSGKKSKSKKKHKMTEEEKMESLQDKVIAEYKSKYVQDKSESEGPDVDSDAVKKLMDLEL